MGMVPTGPQPFESKFENQCKFGNSLAGRQLASKLACDCSLTSASFLPLRPHRTAVHQMPVANPKLTSKQKETASKVRIEEPLPKETENEGPTDSEDCDSSEDVCVYETAEDIRKVHETAEMKLSRLGHRETLWTGKISSYFVILAFLCTYDTMVAFGEGMGEFGTPFAGTYLVFMVVIGFPLLYMEMALGQYTSCNGYAVFQRMAAAMAGIGLASLILNFASLVNDQILVTYFANLFVSAVNIFTNEMPWHQCFDSYNDASCHDFSKTCKEFQPNNGLSDQQNKRLGLMYSHLGSLCYRLPNMEITETELNVITFPSYDFLLYMFVTITVVYLICQKRGLIAKLSQVSCFVTVVVYGTIVVAIVFDHSLEFPFVGVMNQDTTHNIIKHSQYVKMVAAAAFMVLKSLKLGQGALIYLGSQHRFRNSLVQDCFFITLIIPVIQFFHAFCHGMVINSYDMYLARGSVQVFEETHKKWVDQADTITYVMKSGHPIFELALFVQSLRIYEHMEPMMICVFSLMGTLVTISCKIIRAEILISTITDSFPIISDTMSKKVVLHLTVCLCSISTFVLQSRTGFELMIAFERMVVPVMGVTIVLFQLLTVCHFYGPRRLLANIMTMNMRKNHEQEARLIKTLVNALIIGLWCFVIPGLLLFAVITRIYFGFPGRSAQSPIDAPVMFTFGVLFIIPVYAAKRIVQQYHTSKNVEPVLRPNRDLWGPRSSEDREMALKVEKIFRAI